MAAISLKEVNKIYPNGYHAVKNVDLDCDDHEFVVLLGPSGCGKSSILRMIAGLEEISAGNLYIGDRLVNQVEAKDRDVAMVFQNYALYPHMTVFDNMAFALRLRKANKPEITRKVQETAAMLDIAELLSMRPRQLSGGQMQRVALGRAMVRDPQVFLMDEPLSNLDMQLRVQMRAELIRMHKKLGTTTIYVTHDQMEAMTMGSVIVVMKDGVLQQAGPPLAVYENPINMFVAGFIGNPGMNFLEAELDGSDRVNIKYSDLRLMIPECRRTPALRVNAGKSVMLGIRPEDICCRAADGEVYPGGLPAQVDIIEPVGHETYLHFNLGNQHLVARAPRSFSAQRGDKINMSFDKDKMHIFSTDRQQSLI